MRLRRHSIYRDWRPEVVSTVTLQQATWLLLGLDPNNLERSSAEYRTLRKRRHREVLSRLEYAVGAHKLRPVGKPVQGVARRFRLTEVASIASQLNLAKENAEELLSVCKMGSNRPTHYRVADARKRWEIHRQFVASLGDAATPTEQRQQTSSRRKSRPKPLNVSLPFGSAEYCRRVRHFCEREAADSVHLLVSDHVIDLDRRDLNIQVRMGRPRKSP